MAKIAKSKLQVGQPSAVLFPVSLLSCGGEEAVKVRARRLGLLGLGILLSLIL
jgi:hypothetical protein